jgi:hypothetical protein
MTATRKLKAWKRTTMPYKHHCSIYLDVLVWSRSGRGFDMVCNGAASFESIEEAIAALEAKYGSVAVMSTESGALGTAITHCLDLVVSGIRVRILEYPCQLEYQDFSGGRAYRVPGFVPQRFVRTEPSNAD